MLLWGAGMFVSEPDAVEAPLGFLAVDWLKRRTKSLLRVGGLSVGVPVNDGMLLLLGVVVLAGTLALNVPGAGKSLRAGSYARLLAKSSKLTAGRKSYEPMLSVGSSFAGPGCGCLVKLKRGFEGTVRVAAVSFAGVGRKERVSREATLAPLAILLHHASVLSSP